MDTKEWKEIIELYNSIKYMYALCEETDPELKTNLQPLNEFRAALDHLMRIEGIVHLDEYKEENIQEEARKLKSHLRRAFFDIGDMLSINYRNMIIDILVNYDSSEIEMAIPKYYPEIRPRLEELSSKIAQLRTDRKSNSVDDYIKIIEELKNKLNYINSALPALQEIKNKNKRTRRKNIITQWIIPIAAIVIGAVVGIVCRFA